MKILLFKVVRESLRKTLIEDSAKGYSCTKDRDTFGRLSQVTIRLGGHVAYQMKLSYNERSQVGNSINLRLTLGYILGYFCGF